MSLIKSVFDSYDEVMNIVLYGTEEQKKKVNKPFTFSVHFPDYKGINGNIISCGSQVNLFFSTNNEVLITSFYNGVKKKKEIVIGENSPITFKIKNIHLLPLKKINSNKVVFKTLSPILVNQKEDNLMFIPPTHPDFDNTFRNIISNQANEFKVLCKPNDIHIEICFMKKLPLTHYNQTMTSWLGEFIMEAPREVLQLVYDIGIGVRRSQGFGMLEIEKQY
jgi:CRISPR-associated endoribonuclease Cas6